MNANLREADYTCGDFFNLLCVSVPLWLMDLPVRLPTEAQRRIKSGL
jgi:hypothetical protein